MKTELFKKVYIKSEADLPKNEGMYFVNIRHTDEGDTKRLYWFAKKPLTEDEWMEDVDWYLLPIEQEPVTESVTVPSEKQITQESIKYDRASYCSHTSGEDPSYHFIVGANYVKSQVKTIDFRGELYGFLKFIDKNFGINPKALADWYIIDEYLKSKQ